MLLQAPVDLMLTRLGLNWLSMLAGVGFWIWSVILAVLAIRAALRTETGRAVAIFLIPVGVGFAVLILAVAAFVVAVVSMMPSL